MSERPDRPDQAIDVLGARLGAVGYTGIDHPDLGWRAADFGQKQIRHIFTNTKNHLQNQINKQQYQLIKKKQKPIIFIV